MSHRRRALIIGGSLGGLFAAHILRRIGWEVMVFERSGDDLAARGAGIGISDQLIEVMQRIGLPFSESSLIKASARICLDRSGAIVAEVARRGCHGSWGGLYRALRDALPPAYQRFGTTLQRVEQDKERVFAIFADGSSVEGTLLVGADGMHSTVRRQFLPDVKPQPAGYVVWRGLVEERNMPSAALASLHDRIMLALPPREMFQAFFVPALSNDGLPGRRRYYFFWYMPIAYAAALSSYKKEPLHEADLSSPLASSDATEALKLRAAAILAPQLAAVVARAIEVLIHPVVDLESETLVFGRTLLLGDAAFVVRPHVAAGVTKAALDAARLGEALTMHASDVLSALRYYDIEQRRFGCRLIARGRYLGTYFEAQDKASGGVAPSSPRWNPEAMMMEQGRW